MRRGIGTGEAKREEVCSKFSWFSEWHSLWVVVVVVPTGVRGCEKQIVGLAILGGECLWDL